MLKAQPIYIIKLNEQVRSYFSCDKPCMPLQVVTRPVIGPKIYKPFSPNISLYFFLL